MITLMSYSEGQQINLNLFAGALRFSVTLTPYPERQHIHLGCTATTPEIFLILFQKLREELRITSTSIILYRVGETIGNLVYRQLVQELTEEDLLQTYLQRCKLIHVTSDLRFGKVVFRSKNTPLGSQLKNLGIPVDFICSGCIAGILGRVLGNKVVCEEASCIARGDEYCEFVTAFKTQIKKIKIEFDEEEVEKSLKRILESRQPPFLEGPPSKKQDWLSLEDDCKE